MNLKNIYMFLTFPKAMKKPNENFSPATPLTASGTYWTFWMVSSCDLYVFWIHMFKCRQDKVPNENVSYVTQGFACMLEDPQGDLHR